jgi:hypothetical protein
LLKVFPFLESDAEICGTRGFRPNYPNTRTPLTCTMLGLFAAGTQIIDLLTQTSRAQNVGRLSFSAQDESNLMRGALRAPTQSYDRDFGDECVRAASVPRHKFAIIDSR